jgi:hypothetical protein
MFNLNYLLNINLIGALTSKIYAYKFRAWEIQKFETINYLDIFGSKIELNIYAQKIIRILPSIKTNLLFNKNYWISDYIRFSFENLYINRQNLPQLNILKFLTLLNIKFISNNLIISWKLAIYILILKYILLTKFSIKKNILINIFLTNFNDIYDSFFTTYYKLLLTNLNLINNNFNLSKYNQLDIQDLFLNNNFFCLVNINLRYDNPILLLKLQKIKNLCLFYFGFKNFILNFDLITLKIIYCGNQSINLINTLIGKSRNLIKLFYLDKKLNIINMLINFNIKTYKSIIVYQLLTKYTKFKFFDFKNLLHTKVNTIVSNINIKNTNLINFLFENDNNLISKKRTNFEILNTMHTFNTNTYNLILPNLHTFEKQNFYTSINNNFLYNVNILKLQKFSFTLRETLFCFLTLIFKILNLKIKNLFYLKLLTYKILNINVIKEKSIFLPVITNLFIKRDLIFKIYFLKYPFFKVFRQLRIVQFFKIFYNLFFLKKINYKNYNFKKLNNNFKFISSNIIFLNNNLSNTINLILKKLIKNYNNFIIF